MAAHDPDPSNLPLPQLSTLMVHACCAPVAHLSFTHPSPSPCLVETTSRCEAALPQNRRLSLDSTLLRIVLFGLAAMRAQWFSCCVLRPHVCLKIRASQEAKAMAISYKMGLSMFSDEARILHNAADSGVGDLVFVIILGVMKASVAAGSSTTLALRILIRPRHILKQRFEVKYTQSSIDRR